MLTHSRTIVCAQVDRIYHWCMHFRCAGTGLASHQGFSIMSRKEAPSYEACLSIWVLIIAAVAGHAACQLCESHQYEKMFVIGDSSVDNGDRDPNDNTYTAIGRVNQPWQPPYGRSRPGHPAGRFSDGNLLSDFFSNYLGLKSPPYRDVLTSSTQLQDGINFAVGGAGVFNNLGFTKTGDQIAQLKSVLNTPGLSYPSDIYSKSLILYGVNGNDYAAYSRNGGDVASIVDYISAVVDQSCQDLLELYSQGFRSFVVEKLYPLGCTPSLTAVSNFALCNEAANTVAALHNLALQTKVTSLSLPGAKIIFLNNRLAFNTVVYNFTNPDRLRPCCTGLQFGKLCGDVDASGNPQYTLCTASAQEKLFWWDEFHPTEAGWAYIFSLFLEGFPFVYTDGKSLRTFLGCN